MTNRLKPAETYTHTHTHTHTSNLLLSPKQIGTICFAISILISAPLFATDPDISTATASCNDSVFNSNTGPVNIEVNWEPNEIGLRWYNNNTLMESVADVSSDCTYDSTLTPPSTIPTRTGYTFTGWRVRPQMDFSEIPTNGNGTNRWAIDWYNNGNRCSYATNSSTSTNSVACNSDATFSKELQTYEWKVRYSHGDLYGMSGCSTTSGSFAQSGNPVIGDGQYCWCKATGYKANGSSEVKGPLSALSWVFRINGGSASGCARNCAGYCDSAADYNAVFRVALFAPAQ